MVLSAVPRLRECEGGTSGLGGGVSGVAVARFLVLAACLAGFLVFAAVARGEEYVVRLDPGQDPAQHARADATRLGGKVDFVYRSALRGYAINVAPDRAAQLASTSGVAAVEPSRTLQLDAGGSTATPCPYDFCQFLPRGVDRIDGDTSSTKSGDGRGSVPVNVAVIDSGISTSHPRPQRGRWQGLHQQQLWL